MGGAGAGAGYAYSYHFTEISGAGSCATGNQMFSTLAAMCAGLESDSLNHSCALDARQAFFAEECPGEFLAQP